MGITIVAIIPIEKSGTQEELTKEFYGNDVVLTKVAETFTDVDFILFYFIMPLPLEKELLELPDENITPESISYMMLSLNNHKTESSPWHKVREQKRILL